MIQEPGPLPPLPVHPKAKLASSTPSEFKYRPGSPGRRPSAPVPPLGAKVIPKTVSSKGSIGTIGSTNTVTPLQPKRKKKKNQEKKQEKKAAKTLSAILLAFIVTWTPYNVSLIAFTSVVLHSENTHRPKGLCFYFLDFLFFQQILVLLRTVLQDQNAIPKALWDLSYYLCYINSTINPVCYALCNASFRRTYIRILTCKWDNSKRQAVNRGYYN
jgi:muscarinic acetylcholine receptor M3